MVGQPTDQDANFVKLEPNDLLLFARVADEGSFSRAAERLALPKSTVSRRGAALEAQLGERPLLRTTRKPPGTHFGLPAPRAPPS